MRILLTNDDGIHARGLGVLERIARTISDDITIVAPAEEQSGKSRSLTLTEPFRVRRMGDGRYAVRGTPTDCVMFALAEAMKDSPPDLILSGVNRGGNLGEDVSYSGTVSAAMEGALAGIRSVALSQRYEHAGMLAPAALSGVIPRAFIHAFPNNGPYQSPPTRKPASAASTIAIQ